MYVFSVNNGSQETSVWPLGVLGLNSVLESSNGMVDEAVESSVYRVLVFTEKMKSDILQAWTEGAEISDGKKWGTGSW